MSRTTTVNLSPAGEAAGTAIVLAAVLLAEAMVDRWMAPPVPQMDPHVCLDVCYGFIKQVSVTECVCGDEPAD